MAEPYLGEIKLFPFGYAPKGWALCNGVLLTIQQNAALYSLLGTTYGGDGVNNFALPDLRGRMPVNAGVNQRFQYVVNRGDKGGSETVALPKDQMPAHTHTVTGDNSLANVINPLASNTCLWSTPATPTPPVTAVPINPFSNATANAQLDPSVLGQTGGGQGHNNMQPFLVLNFCIATIGVYPPRPS